MEDLEITVPLISASKTTMLKVIVEHDKHWNPKPIGEVLRLRGL